MFTKLLREPMLQFLIAGAVLFAVYQIFNPGSAGDHDGNVIKVSNATLNSLSNIRNRTVSPLPLNEQEKDVLAKEYIEEEALYRTALQMGLNEDDFIVRRRMVQKLSFLLEDLNTEQIEIDEKTLRTFYEENREQFSSAEKLSFSHLYLASKEDKEIADLKTLLNESKMSTEQALAHSDPFLLEHSYKNLTVNEMATIFGQRFTEELFSLAVEGDWQGPVQSGYGQHLVLIENRQASEMPPFASIHSEIAEAYYYREKQRLNDLVRQRIVSNFTVVRDYE